jgi:hypothetical protein
MQREENDMAMGSSSENLKTGDWIRIRPYEKIRSMLDKNNSHDGLLFMGKMAQYCGTKGQVLRRVNWVYDECSRKMLKCKGIVVLKNLVCDGKRMLGDRECGRCCSYFWKEEWLEKTAEEGLRNYASNASSRVQDKDREDAACIPDQPDEQHSADEKSVICQYTRMTSMGRAFNRIEEAEQFLMRIGPALGRRVSSYREKLTGKRGKSRSGAPEAGENMKAPIQEGELVRILPYERIKSTLDERGTYKGLGFLENAKQFCGGTYKVLKIPEFVLDQGGEKVNKCRNLIILEGPTCDGKGTVLEEGCDRSCLHYWKTDWLEKVS